MMGSPTSPVTMPEAPSFPLPTLSLPIAGMTCAACAGRVQRALGKVPGITDATVNLATERAELRGTAALPDLVAAVERAGYSVPESRVELGIGGMTCATCALRVEKALGKVPGVLAASVNLATETASIRLLAGTEETALAAAIQRAGYTVRAAETTP